MQQRSDGSACLYSSQNCRKKWFDIITSRCIHAYIIETFILAQKKLVSKWDQI